MALAFDPHRLPPALRPLVERALQDVDGCEDAIEALEREASASEASPDVLVALALVTYHEAASLVLTQLEHAAERALALLDEAERRGKRTDSLARLRSLCRRSIERERSRERRLLARIAWADDDASPRDVIELAHRLMLRGDTDLAAELLRRADEREAAEDVRPAPRADDDGVAWLDGSRSLGIRSAGRAACASPTSAAT